MPTVIQGFEISNKPASTEVESFPIFVTIPAATTRTITFPIEFNAVAISLQIENMDSANAASYRLNSSTGSLLVVFDDVDMFSCKIASTESPP